MYTSMMRGPVAALCAGVLVATPALAQKVLYAPIEVRSGAGTEYAVKAVLPAGRAVDVEWSIQGYDHVVYDGQRAAFLPRRYVREAARARCAAAGIVDGRCVVATTAVNIRAGTSTADEKRGMLERGRVAALDGFEGDYARLRLAVRETGYVRSPLLRQATAVEAAQVTGADGVLAAAADSEPESASRSTAKAAPGDAAASVSAASVPASPNAPPASAEDALPATAARAPSAAAPTQRERNRKAAPPAATKPAPPPRSPARPNATRARPALAPPRLTWTAGIGVGHSFSMEEEEDVERAFAERGVEARFDNYRRDDPAYEVFAKWHLLPMLGLRVSYLAMTDVDSEVQLNEADLEAAQAIIEDEYPAGGRGATATLEFDIRAGGWLLSLGGGAFFPTERELRIRAGETLIKADGPSSTPLYRLAIEKELRSQWHVGLDLNVTDRNGLFVAPIALKIQRRWYR